MDHLGLQKSMAYNTLKGEGFDAISRCRQLAAALKIYPPLLGIDARYYPIECYAYWWHEYGFSFNADAEAYPVMSEVVAYLRMQRIQRDEGGRVKVWSQKDLGDATGLRSETVYRIERGKSPLILESMSRRACIASALGTGAGEMEPTIFRLFGLAPQAYGVPVQASESLPAVHFSTHVLSDEMLREYHQKLAAFFTEYSTSHAQDSVAEAQEWVQQLPALLSRATTSAERVSLLVLLSRTHRFLANVTREQCEKEHILFHTSRAVEWAEHSMTLLDPKLRCDQTGLLMTNELLASALWTFALASYESGEYELAQGTIDRALEVLPGVQSRHLKAEVLLAAALIHAYTVTSPIDQQTVLSYIDRAFQTHSLILSQVDSLDENFFQCGKGMLFLSKARALSSPKMEGVTGASLFDLLRDARRLTHPDLIRQQVIIAYLEARTYLTEGSYQRATEVALCALEKCRQIRSRRWKQYIEELYQQLLNTPFRDKPLLAYLGMKLRMWDGEID
jgi:hypothetical protein